MAHSLIHSKMKTITLPNQQLDQHRENANLGTIVDFYDEATEDYTFWSKDYNMHFGYFILGITNLFKRDTMLNEMNRQVLKRLRLSSNNSVVADLGCGMGGTMKYLMNQKSNLSTIGVTISDFQVKHGNEFLKKHKGIILKENYTQTSIHSNSMDGVIAMESLCHSGHSNQSLKEAFRILKKGKHFVMTDAFLKKPPSDLCMGSLWSYKGLCRGWSLEGLGQINKVTQSLKDIGFSKVDVKEVSLRVAPSVFHVPFAIPLFILKQFFKGKRIKKESWNNLKASFYSLICGLHLKDFGYYIITATK